MNEHWKDLTVSAIGAAVYVAPNTGKHAHKNRPFHGFVLNDAEVLRDYCFDDGRVMRTGESCLFYLPKGSTYEVKQIHTGACYAINFDAEIEDEPFCIPIQNMSALLRVFKAATDAWKSRDEARYVLAMRAVYEAACQIQRERQRQYTSPLQRSLIAPAVEALDSRFTENDLTVTALAAMCGISEVYFRRLFLSAFGTSPKEYMIGKRMDYAKSLLESGHFSVLEVANTCGYAEPCHFSREFLRRVGVTPTRYRAQ